MYVEAFAAGILIGLIRKGSIFNFKFINLRKISLLITAFAIQIILIFVLPLYLFSIGVLLHISSYLLLFVFLWFNRSIFNYLFPVGILLNFLAILSNGGSMPVCSRYMSVEAAERVNSSITHTVIDETTRLPWLGDIIFISWPFQQMISLGDVFISLGIFLFVQKIMLSSKENIQNL